MSTQLTTTKNTDVRDLLRSDKILEQVRLALPQHMTPDRMVRVMCTAMLRNPKLLDCRQESLVEALMICSQAGIEPDGRNAHLIPYGDKVQVIFDYKGLVAIAERNGVQSIYADMVCDNDQFDAFVDGGIKKLTHRVDWKKARGNPYAYFASCIRNDRLDYEVMTKDEVDAIRKRSKASSSGPWVTDYNEMAKKTVLRRMSKRWDLSPEAAEAITADSDTPDFESSVTVAKTPQFPGPPAALLDTPKPEPRKRKEKVVAPEPVADGDLGPAPETDPVVKAEDLPLEEPTPEKSFEEMVDGEKAEVVALQDAIKTMAERLKYTDAEALQRTLKVIGNRKLFVDLPENRKATLYDVKAEKYSILSKNIGNGALDAEIKGVVL